MTGKRALYRRKPCTITPCSVLYLVGIYNICEFLEISPKEFFDLEAKEPDQIRDIISNLKKLTPEQLQNIASIVKELAK